MGCAGTKPAEEEEPQEVKDYSGHKEAGLSEPDLNAVPRKPSIKPKGQKAVLEEVDSPSVEGKRKVSFSIRSESSDDNQGPKGNGEGGEDADLLAVSIVAGVIDVAVGTATGHAGEVASDDAAKGGGGETEQQRAPANGSQQ